MIECPACASNRVPEGATHCNSCGYALGKPAAKVLLVDSAELLRTTDIFTLDIGPKGRFVARSIATVLMPSLLTPLPTGESRY